MPNIVLWAIIACVVGFIIYKILWGNPAPSEYHDSLPAEDFASHSLSPNGNMATISAEGGVDVIQGVGCVRLIWDEEEGVPANYSVFRDGIEIGRTKTNYYTDYDVDPMHISESVIYSVAAITEAPTDPIISEDKPVEIVQSTLATGIIESATIMPMNFVPGTSVSTYDTEAAINEDELAKSISEVTVSVPEDATHHDLTEHAETVTPSTVSHGTIDTVTGDITVDGKLIDEKFDVSIFSADPSSETVKLAPSIDGVTLVQGDSLKMEAQETLPNGIYVMTSVADTLSYIPPTKKKTYRDVEYPGQKAGLKKADLRQIHKLVTKNKQSVNETANIFNISRDTVNRIVHHVKTQDAERAKAKSA